MNLRPFIHIGRLTVNVICSQGIPPEIASALGIIQHEMEYVMTDLTTLTADVTENSNQTSSIVTLLTNIKAELDAAGTDPAALKALSDSLEANNAAIAAAVLANTPAAPTA